MKLVFLSIALVTSLTLTPVASAKTCVLKGDAKTTLKDLEVEPEGVKPIQVVVTGWPLEATIVRGSAEVAVSVKGAYTFGAQTKADRLFLRPSKGLSAFADGRLMLGAGAKLTASGVREDGSLDLSVEVASDVTVSGFSLGCGALMVGAMAHSLQKPKKPKGVKIVATAPRFNLYEAPHGKSPLRVSTVNNPKIVFAVLKKMKSGWWKVRAEWKDGTRLEGWTSKAGLTAPAPMAGVGRMGPSGCGRTPQTERKLVIRAGASVYVEVGKGKWATVPQPLETSGFRSTTGKGWYVRPPAGLSSRCRYFWFRAADVKTK